MSNLFINKWGNAVVGVKPIKNDTFGLVRSILCGSASHVGGATHLGTFLLDNTFVGNGVKTTLYYGGGNGGSYPGLTVSSTGVTGLYAHTPGGLLNIGGGSVTYTISGMPSQAGTASFSVVLGGKSCVFTRQVITIG